jgi:MFS family permease
VSVLFADCGAVSEATRANLAFNNSAAAGIPAAINLIIHVFPRETEQHIALAAFGGAGELANIGGFIIGGILLLAGWRWVFWLLPIVCFPLALLAFFIVPKRETLKAYQLQGLREEAESDTEAAARATELLRTLEEEQIGLKFDYVGSFLVVAAAVLSVFGLTDGGEGSGWYVSPFSVSCRNVLIFRFAGDVHNQSPRSSLASFSFRSSFGGNRESINVQH